MDVTDKIRPWMKECRLCHVTVVQIVWPVRRDSVVQIQRSWLQGLLSICGRSLHFRERGIRSCIFSGCSLGCNFCQNRRISRGQRGKKITLEHLVELFFQLQEQGANNINLVTAGHFLPQVAVALEMAKEQGLHIPVVYNSSGYEKAKTLKMLDGLVDIYLPDFKYMDAVLAKKIFSCTGLSGNCKRSSE